MELCNPSKHFFERIVIAKLIEEFVDLQLATNLLNEVSKILSKICPNLDFNVYNKFI